MNKQIMAYSSNTILLNDKKEWSIDTGNMSETNLWVWIRTVAVSGGKRRLIAKKKAWENLQSDRNDPFIDKGRIEWIDAFIKKSLHLYPD